MKKIFIVDGGPRKNMNTAQMIEKFKEGVQSVGADIAVEHVRLYDYDFHGCYSCMLCKMENTKFGDYCGRKDGITDVLKEVAYADGLVLASPIYYGDITAQTKCFIERLTFPWLDYVTFETHPPKSGVPSAIIYTMNAAQEHQEMMEDVYRKNEQLLARFYEKPERVLAINTKQVKDYSRFHFTPQWAESHDRWHEEQFPHELQQAFEAGKRMAAKVAAR